MITTYAFINVLCLLGLIYFVYRILTRKFDSWILPFLLIILSYFSTSLLHIEVLKELATAYQLNSPDYIASLQGALIISKYVLGINIIIFILYVLVFITAKIAAKIKR